MSIPAVEVDADHARRNADRRELGADRRRREQAGEDRQSPRAVPHNPSREMFARRAHEVGRETSNFAACRALDQPCHRRAPEALPPAVG